MKLLVTGSSGFVGGKLISELKRRSNEVVAVVRTKTTLNADHVVIVPDFVDAEFPLEALSGCDVVIHLAARVHVMGKSKKNTLDQYLKVNVQATLNLAKSAAKMGVKRFIYISSIKVNGEHTIKNKLFTANDIPAPADLYGYSKYKAEEELKKLLKETGVELVIIRPPLVYGPKVKANFRTMMKCLCYRVPLPFGSVNNIRSLVGLDNLVDLIITCANHPKAINQTFLVSDGYDVSTSALLKSMAVALGTEAILIPVPDFLLKIIFLMIGKEKLSLRLLDSLQIDITKTRELLDWTPPVSFDEGLKRTAKDFLQD